MGGTHNLDDTSENKTAVDSRSIVWDNETCSFLTSNCKSHFKIDKFELSVTYLVLSVSENPSKSRLIRETYFTSTFHMIKETF
jgi:hypothetical protein